MQSLSATIEAILFATADEYRVGALAKLLERDAAEVEAALASLAETLEARGIMLVRAGDTVALATRPEYGSILEAIRKDELSGELSKASAETLAIVCYRPGATKAEIELIRGVNASYSLRSLAMRGLIESRTQGRTTAYHPTLDVLRHYGIASFEALPKYAETTAKLAALLTDQSDSQP